MNSTEIQKQLKTLNIRSLSAQEQERVWDHVRFGMKRSSETKKTSRNRFSFLQKSIAFGLIFGMTAGTTFAADDARPGDTLFSLDRAMEDLQLSIADENKKDELKVKFALERVAEVKSILKEVSAEQVSSSTKTPPSSLGAETKSVEKNASTPKVDLEDTEEIVPIKTHVEQKPLLVTSSEKTLSLSENATPSLEKIEKEVETANMSDGDKKRIELALGTALSFLGDVKGELSEQGNESAISFIDLMVEQLNKEMTALPSEVTFEVDLSAKKNKVRFEITSKESQPQVNIDVTPKVSEETQEVTESVPKEEQVSETKLKIKDGGMTITEPIKTEETTEKSTESIEATSTKENNETKKSDTASTSDEVTKKDDAEETTVKVIVNKLDKNFEISVTDQNARIYDIVQEYLDREQKKTEEQP